jgi:hypothetical protein
MIRSDQTFGGGEIFGGPVIQICADAQRALHRTQHSVGQRGGAAVQPVRRIGHPRHHDLRRVSVSESVLHRQPIKWIGVIGRPDFIGVGQNSQVHPASAAGARFDFDFRMFLA